MVMIHKLRGRKPATRVPLWSFSFRPRIRPEHDLPSAPVFFVSAQMQGWLLTGAKGNCLAPPASTYLHPPGARALPPTGSGSYHRHGTAAWPSASSQPSPKAYCSIVGGIFWLSRKRLVGS